MNITILSWNYYNKRITNTTDFQSTLIDFYNCESDLDYHGDGGKYVFMIICESRFVHVICIIIVYDYC